MAHYLFFKSSLISVLCPLFFLMQKIKHNTLWCIVVFQASTEEFLSLKHSYQCEKPLRRLVLVACRTPKHWNHGPGSAWCNSIFASEVQILLLQSFFKLDFLPCSRLVDLLIALSWQSEALSLPPCPRTPSDWVDDTLLDVLHVYPGLDWEYLQISWR